MKEFRSYLNLNNVQLNRALRDVYLRDLDKFKSIKNYLSTSERYRLDYVFKIIVDTQDVAYFLTTGETDKYFDKLDDLLYRINNSGEVEHLILNLNTLANAYATVDKMYKAISCYMQIINIEEKKDKKSLLSAIAYHNIGHLYRLYGNYEIALPYTLKSRGVLSPLPNGEYEHDSFWIFNTCELSAIYFELDRTEEGLYYYHLAKSNLSEQTMGLSQATFQKSEMKINFINNDLASLEKNYESIKRSLIEANDYPSLLTYIVEYYEYSLALNADMSKLIKEVEYIYNMSKGEALYRPQVTILRIIINYYVDRNELEKAKPYIEKMSSIVKKYYKQDDDENKKHIDFMYEKYMYTEDLEQEKHEQKKLKEHYQEIVRKNNAIEELYLRLNTISEIGKSITDSLDFSDLFQKLYHNLSGGVRIDNFTLMDYVEDKNLLHTTFSHDALDGEEYKEIKLGDERPLLSKIVKERETLLINGSSYHERLLKELEIDIERYQSFIISPIIFKSKLVSIAMISSIEKDSYKKITKEFVIQASIFMAVAIVNIKRKKKLSKIVQENIKTKKELQEASDSLKTLSQQDSLTGINNRLAFYNFYYDKLARAVEKQKSISLYMIDVDYFKHYNDTFGHLKGDEVLIRVAQLISEQFSGENESLARFGGEEFIAFSTDDKPEDALEKAESLRKTVEELAIVHSKSPVDVLTISIGVASIRKPKAGEDAYIGISDKALYQAKNSGRNKVVQIIE